MIPLMIIVIPILFALLSTFLPSRWTGTHRWLGLSGTALPLALCIHLWNEYDSVESVFMQGSAFEFQLPWISLLGAKIHLGIDGLSLVMINLSALLAVLVILFSWNHVQTKQKSYYIIFLLLSASMFGVFLARDLLLFYIFWESMLLPMYFMVGIWGGERRLYASIKFVLFTLAGSLLMLISIVVLFQMHLSQFHEASMFIPDLYKVDVPPALAPWLFLSFLLAFAIKTPIFPLHTWLPDAHTEAPSGGSVILAGILLKVGVYGFIRLLIPLFPETALDWGWTLGLLGAIGIIYGGLVAWAQSDIKKLVAYSSISHLGFVVLGLFTINKIAVTGGILQGVVHGINTGGLFLLVGMIYNRVHTRDMDEIGDLATELPFLSTCLVIISFASVALPTTNGFVGEFIILSSSFRKFPWLVALATLGAVISALYMLKLLRKSVFGTSETDMSEVSDLNFTEALSVAPLIVLVFWIGIYPAPVINKLKPSVDKIFETFQLETTPFPISKTKSDQSQQQFAQYQHLGE